MAAREAGVPRGRASKYSDIDAQAINRKGRQLVIRLALLIRTAAIHDVHNEALQRSIDFFLHAANDLLKQFAPVIVQGDQDQVYVNDYRLRGDATLYSNIKLLLADLKQRGTGGLTLHQDVSRSDVLHLLEVLREPMAAAAVAEGHERLNEGLARLNVTSISFNRYLELGATGEQQFTVRDKQSFALKTYAKILVAMKRVLAHGEELKALDRLKMVKNVQSLIDLCYDDELFFSGMRSLKCEGEYAYFHPVHVAMLAVQMGKHIGLARKHLLELSLAALFYDLGRVKLGPIQLEKAEALSADEWEAVRRHPLRSAREVLRARSLNEAVRKRLVVSFEHHLHLDERGYPQRIQTRLPHLFSRIVAICDAYDALTTTRPHRDGYLPAEALKIMLDESRDKFDPALLKVLVNLLEIYPLGTLVLLSSGEIGSVYHTHADPELKDRPIVRVLTDEHRQAVPPRLVNLAEEANLGASARRILHTLDAEDAKAFLPGGAT